MTGVGDYSYIIIGGTTKAATTSLYFYLGDHPQVCGANLKESRFFLDEDYPLTSAFRYTQGLEKYHEYFLHCGADKIRMEATPDYLYSPGTPERIRKALPNAKCIFILREPVSRLVSWYKFARQNNDIPEKMGFDEYVNLQLYPGGGTEKKQHMRALEQGRYSYYLRAYYEAFGNDGVHIAFYEDLSNDPVAVLGKICDFSGIMKEFYYSYDFKIYNRTERMRSPMVHAFYKKALFSIRRRTLRFKFLKSELRRLRRVIDPLYHCLNAGLDEDLLISISTRRALEDYYREERYALRRLSLGEIPWPGYGTSGEESQ